MHESEAVYDDGHGAASCDGLLLRRLAMADPAGYDELCERYGRKIQRFAAARLSGDQQLAEEVMVQTLADVAASAVRLGTREVALSAWVYGVARREIQRELRRQGRRKSVPAAVQVPLEAIGEVAEQHEMAASALAQLEAQRLLKTLAGLLSEVEFEVLVLSSLDELSAKDIGRVIGRSQRAVHSLLHRAKQKARERLVRDEE